MSDSIKHECGIALLRLLKPLSYYKEKYGSPYWAINKMYLLMEKQHNRGQDGAGLVSLKINVEPGTEYISRERSVDNRPIIDIFNKVTNGINEAISEFDDDKTKVNDTNWLKANVPFLGDIYLGHLRYGTYGKNSIKQCHPFIRRNNWMHRNLITAGNFNMTNVDELFDQLVNIGQQPVVKADTITILEKIGHFLDEEVANIYNDLKFDDISKKDASELIEKRLNIQSILKKASKKWDGGYAMAGIVGHGDAFVLRDPNAIRPAFYHKNDEFVVVTSERPVIQTVMNVEFDDIKEITPGSALIIRKNGFVEEKEIMPQQERKSCSFERIYFSRGSDADIYRERIELGKRVVPHILKMIDNDLANSVFSFIPNTAENAFYGMLVGLEDELHRAQKNEILKLGKDINENDVSRILSSRVRHEKIAIKDVKLRTFITEDTSRDELVEHVYDITYGTVKPNDNLVVIDDSVVRGTTLKKSIIKILDRLKPKKIVVVSSAPQIRYPDCYGIDMAKLGDFVAFKAAIELINDTGRQDILKKVYDKCVAQVGLDDEEVVNYVKEIYEPFSANEISKKIAELITDESVNSEVEIFFQTIEDLHASCPNNLGDWYFTGNYPTPGGNRVVNKAYINYYLGNNLRAY